jgi:hypothetical protein
MYAQVKIAKESKVREELAFQKTKFGIELAQTHLMVLQNLTQARILKIRKDELNRAQSRERILQDALKLEKAREDRIRQQIAACRILAPLEGKVVLERPDPRFMASEAEILTRQLSDLQDLLAEQHMAVQVAEASNQAAVNQVQTADLTQREFGDGTWWHDRFKAQLQIKQAEVELLRARQCVEWSKRMVLKGLIEMPEKVLADRWVETATRALEQCQKAMKALSSEIREKRLRSLGGDIEWSRRAQQASEAILELARAREARLGGKVDELQIQAAAASKSLAASPELKAGCLVHEGQVLARIVPDKTSAKAPEDQGGKPGTSK